MAMHLLAAGHELRVWNRSEGKADPLIHEGAILAGTPAEAELGADAVVTMLFDDRAHFRGADTGRPRRSASGQPLDAVQRLRHARMPMQGHAA